MTTASSSRSTAGRLLSGVAALLLLSAGAASAESGDFALVAQAVEMPVIPGASQGSSPGLADLTGSLSLGLNSILNLFNSQGSPAPDPDFHLDVSEGLREEFSGTLPAFEPGQPMLTRAPHPDYRTALVTAGAFAVVPVVGLLSWWRYDKAPFHTNPEGWLGENTYAGGADKASHFVVSYMGTRLLSGAYRKLGNSPAQSNWYAFGVVALSGVLVEIGDGTSHYGYSWPDIGADVLGAATGVAIQAAGVEDLVGFRIGWVGAEQPPSAVNDTGSGTDYSREMYSMDIKVAGAARRMNWRPGPSRFLLFSVTYGTKGYRYSPPELRERNVGFEIGLNMPEILRAIKVPENKWWGKALITTFEFIRLPFTGIGYQYDLNHGRWHGPTAGNAYDPGP
jgi:uncharacterized protein YfiM (DUF2279 family)